MTASGENNHQRTDSVTVSEVTPSQLAQVRGLVTDIADRTGIDAERTAQFVLAVNEIVINAIQHGGGCDRVTVTAGRDRVVVDVEDRGLGLLATPALPDPDAVHGRGVWLARRLSDDLELVASSTGTHVRLTAIAPD